MIHTGCPKNKEQNFSPIFHIFWTPCFFVFMEGGDFNKDGLDQDDVDANDQ